MLGTELGSLRKRTILCTAWEKMWQEQTTPWDASGIQPALKDLVENGWAKVGVDWSDLASGGEGKALVPGCGRGYDVLYLASKGFQAVGADISATAIAAAREHYASQHSPPPTVTFEQVDFFKDLPEAFYSLAYDYTFFCAIPPSMRSEWAKAYAKTIRPGGVLITLMWPIGEFRSHPTLVIASKVPRVVFTSYLLAHFPFSHFPRLLLTIFSQSLWGWIFSRRQTRRTTFLRQSRILSARSFGRFRKAVRGSPRSEHPGPRWI
ncbi:S-adenosyl-L-methionine-dependent methyltransferase [Meredithblackwellia eburnea MCA 4105]